MSEEMTTLALVGSSTSMGQTDEAFDYTFELEAKGYLDQMYEEELTISDLLKAFSFQRFFRSKGKINFCVCRNPFYEAIILFLPMKIKSLELLQISLVLLSRISL